VEGADVGRAVAEEGERDGAGPALAGGEGGADRDRQVGADDRERAERPDRDVGQVHRAALAAAEPTLAAEDLGEGPIERRAHRQHRAVPAVGAGHRVALGKRRAGAGRDRLLPLAEVGGPAHQALREEALDPFLEGADLDHSPVQPQQFIVHQHAAVISLF
jgi:hypothetical protein